MKIFGKTISEYIAFQKVILVLIAIVGVGRLGLSLTGVPTSVVKWLSITALMALGTLYYAIRVHPSGFGSYRHLLPLLVIQDFLAEFIVAAGIVIAIVTGKDNIFSIPEYSSGGDGKTWLHVLSHLLIGTIVAPLIFWGVASLIMYVVKKATPSDKPAAAATGQ
jgi:hypothetical protein